MAFCLPIEQTKKFINSLKSGEIDPVKLAELSSAERRTFLEKIVGTKDAAEVNALFESKLLLKNQQAGMIAWAEKVSGLKPEAKKGIVEKINKLDKVLSADEQVAFLEDLASKRMGTDVKFEEAQKLVELAKEVEIKKSQIDMNSAWRSPSRMEYGTSLYMLKEFVGDLKLQGETSSIFQMIKNRDIRKAIIEVGGITRSLVSSVDISLLGRQGLPVLMTNPDIWVKKFVSQFKDFNDSFWAKSTASPNAPLIKKMFAKLEEPAVVAAKADAWSRNNALNGNYTKAELAIGLAREEVFPSSRPGRIPIIGRLFNASDNAFNAGAIKMRADLFDRYISKAERLGIDITDIAELKSRGKLVNSLTGRGNIGRLEVVGEELNTAIFSVRFFKSNLDKLTAHSFDKSITKSVRQEAAMNLLKIVGGTAGLLLTADLLWPGSVTFDPTSSDFGKIKIDDTRFDVSGGQAGIITLASKMADRTKDHLKNEVKFGEPTALDALYTFAENKSSPLFHTFLTFLKGKDSDFEKPSIKKEALNLVTPISIQNVQELSEEENSANKIITTIFDVLGIGTNTYKSK